MNDVVLKRKVAEDSERKQAEAAEAKRKADEQAQAERDTKLKSEREAALQRALAEEEEGAAVARSGVVDEYRALLREVVEVAQKATTTAEESVEMMAEVRVILEKCKDALEALHDERQTQNELQRSQIKAEAASRTKSIEFCTKVITSPWFASAVPMVITWLMGFALWYFGIPTPAPVPTTPAVQESADVGHP